MSKSHSVSLESLPAELLHRILSDCSPSDIACLSRTCLSLKQYISSSPHLWKFLFEKRWDIQPKSPAHDALLTQGLPKGSTQSRRSAFHENGDAYDVHGESRKLFIADTTFETAPPFDYQEQVKRRSWAEKCIGSLETNPIHFMAKYNEILQILLSIARSRKPRHSAVSKIVSTPIESSDAGPSSHYLMELLTSPHSCRNFRRLIYPRADVRRLAEWQVKVLTESSPKEAEASSSRKIDKRQRPNSGSSVVATKRQKYNEPLERENHTRRRSSRLLLHSYPSDLHHLLYDVSGNLLIDDTDSGSHVRLEDIALLNEQLAAELHVLHGIQPSFRHKHSDQSSCPPTSAMRDDDEWSNLENASVGSSDFIPITSSDEDDDIFGYEDDHVRHFRRHLPHEPSLGSERGHEGDICLRARAREIVYDTARYGPENSYGPLRAWRERVDALDGPRSGSRANNTGSVEDNDVDATDITEGIDSESTESASSEPINQIQPDNFPLIDYMDAVRDQVLDYDFGEDDEDFDPDEADDDFDFSADELLLDIREISIALSRGLLPYYESKRLQRAVQDYGLPLRQIEGQVRLFDNHISQDIWRIEKRVDWLVVESIMIVMYCNIRHAVFDHGWGKGFKLPGTHRSLTGRDLFARQVNSRQSPHGYHAWSRWRSILGLPCGWDHSRGTDIVADPRHNPHDSSQLKPYDWAGVESTWIGTYAFLDWSKWAAFNARDPLSRGLAESRNSFDPSLPAPHPDATNTPSLKAEREATGDCLQLRLELLPLSEQRATSDHLRIMTELEGLIDPKWDEHGNLPPGHYPPLCFRGHTLTFQDDEPPIVRGEVHGIVRPIYATASRDYSEGSGVPRQVVAIHWDFSHRYEGEDRWSLSGVQAGPPGSRSAIYGIWGSSVRTDNTSPCGPFAYYKVDERPWKVVDSLLREEGS